MISQILKGVRSRTTTNQLLDLENAGTMSRKTKRFPAALPARRARCRERRVCVTGAVGRLTQARFPHIPAEPLSRGSRSRDAPGVTAQWIINGCQTLALETEATDARPRLRQPHNNAPGTADCATSVLL